ncbi:hypothetical protein EON63_10090, partial [archaeon]
MAQQLVLQCDGQGSYEPYTYTVDTKNKKYTISDMHTHVSLHATIPISIPILPIPYLALPSTLLLLV